MRILQRSLPVCLVQLSGSLIAYSGYLSGKQPENIVKDRVARYNRAFVCFRQPESM